MSTVLVTGASRGLGLEFVRQYAADGWQVLACCRQPEAAGELSALARESDSVRLFALDVTDFAAIDALARRLAGEPIDVLINNAGQFGPKVSEHNDLRQTFGHIDYDVWQDLIRINTFAPIKMAEAFIDHIAASEQKKIASLSTIMSSIAEAAGGYYAYGSSKAALNRAMASLARDVADRGISVAVFCPGWVKTDMGGPMASLTPAQSIAGLRRRIAEMTLENSGTFHQYDGKVLPW